MTRAIAWGVMCYRFGLHPSYQDLAEELVSSCSATLLEIDDANNMSIIKYIPEPMSDERFLDIVNFAVASLNDEMVARA